MSTPPQPLKPRNPQRWFYTWEALGHIPTLRLFLFSPQVNPSARCHNLKAELQPDCLLVVSWIEGAEGNEKTVLKIPVPKVLMDFESPMDVSAREDHIEVRLVLVLPVDHPIVSDFRAGMNANADREDVGTKNEGPLLSLDSDLRLLSAGDVHLYCRACSAKLTRNPLRNFVALPSVDWKEAADNWFGTCCCSFGGISEKLANEYINKLALTEGTCLLDSSSVIICKNDLEGCEFSDDKSHSAPAVSSPLTKIAKGFGNSALRDVRYGVITKRIAKSSRHVLIKCEGLENSSENSTLQMHLPNCNSESVEVNLQARDDIEVSRLSSLEAHNGIGSTLSSNLEYSCHRSGQESSVESHCCFSGNSVHNGNAENVKPTSAEIPGLKGGSELPHISSLASNYMASNFMTRTWNRAKDIVWVEFPCRNCSSLLGSYPSSECVNSPTDDGIRLFKFRISTSPTNGKLDIFRKYSLQRVFIYTLLESASDELSFRTLVRDLNSNSPMLRLVLINSKVWCLYGSCLENDVVDPISEMDLQPFTKVLYSDFTTEAADNLRTMDEGGGSHHDDEVYMLSNQIEELIESLKSSRAKLPVSCSELQGMSVSFVER